MNNKISECKRVEELLSGRLENTLSRDERNSMDSHLSKCEKCRETEDNIHYLKSVMPELNADIPFFVKNRLYYIAEAEEEEQAGSLPYLKWAAAAVGTILLFLNLFYFTNIFPAANKTLHTAVSGIERFIVEAEAFFKHIKDSNNNILIDRNESISKNEEEPDKKETSKMARKEINYG